MRSNVLIETHNGTASVPSDAAEAYYRLCRFAFDQGLNPHALGITYARLAELCEWTSKGKPFKGRSYYAVRDASLANLIVVLDTGRRRTTGKGGLCSLLSLVLQGESVEQARSKGMRSLAYRRRFPTTPTFAPLSPAPSKPEPAKPPSRTIPARASSGLNKLAPAPSSSTRVRAPVDIKAEIDGILWNYHAILCTSAGQSFWRSPERHFPTFKADQRRREMARHLLDCKDGWESLLEVALLLKPIENFNPLDLEGFIRCIPLLRERRGW